MLISVLIIIILHQQLTYYDNNMVLLQHLLHYHPSSTTSTTTAIRYRFTKCCISTTTTTAAVEASASAVSEISYNEYISSSSSSSSITNNHHDVVLSNMIRPNFERKIPLVIRGGAVSSSLSSSKSSRALQLWKSFDYWKETVGHEIARVEIGRSYGKPTTTINDNTDNTPSWVEIPVMEYIQYLQAFEERYGNKKQKQQQQQSNTTTPKQDDIVYMAQNDLFQDLYKDIDIPKFCCQEIEEEQQQQDFDQITVGLGRLYSVMVWLGPYGCVSPMHNDPLDNYFTQYTGKKRFLLFPPHTNVYAGTNGQQSNTSPIDFHFVDNDDDDDNGDKATTTTTHTKYSYDKERYPLLKDDEKLGLSCIIGPGDALYIPSKWYHYVESLETSSSVNIWWR